MHIEVDFEGCVSIQGWLSMVIWDINSESLFKMLQDEVFIRDLYKILGQNISYKMFFYIYFH
jgi:hypothetical protein